MLNLEEAKKYLKGQLDESGDSPWLEDWICGYTDSDHGYENKNIVYIELFNYLDELRHEVAIKRVRLKLQNMSGEEIAILKKELQK